MKWMDFLKAFTAWVERIPPFYHYPLISFPILYAAALYPNWDQLRWVFRPLLITLAVTAVIFYVLSCFVENPHQNAF